MGGTLKRPRTRNIVIASAAVLTLLAGGATAGAAIAASPIDGFGVIHGCYTSPPVNGMLAIHLVNAGTPCPAGTTAITWNQQGPAGAAGPQGPVGPAGPAGSAGPAGLQGPKGDPGPAGTGAAVSSLASGDPNCANGGASVTDGNGNTAFACNGAQGPKGDIGPTGAPGPQGPPGTASGLDALIGTPCNVGTLQAGTLSVTYTRQESGADSVSIACVETNPLFTLTVHIRDTGLNVDELQVTSDTGVINCVGSIAGTSGTCVENFTVPQGTAQFVTLTESAFNGNPTFGGWSGCDHVSTDGQQCFIRVANHINDVTASFS